MTTLDVFTSWVAWPFWSVVGLGLVSMVVEHFDRRR